MLKSTIIIFILFSFLSLHAQLQTDSMSQWTDTITLKEVVINPKNISRKGMDYKITNIQSTFLAETGDILGMLKRTPGIIVSGDQSISVIGSGSPIIYIDGRRVYSTTELIGIPTSNIKSVEVIRQPGVEYPSGTSSVIKLVTIKRFGNYAALSVRNSVEYSKFFSEMPSATLNVALGKWSFLTSLSYRYGHSLSSYKKKLQLPSDNGEWLPVQNICTDFENKAHTYSPMLQIGLNPNEKSSFIATYMGRFVNRNPISTSFDELDNGRIQEIQTFPKNNFTSHTVSAGYTYNANSKKKFSVFTTYQRQKSTNNRNIELPIENVISFFNRVDNSDLFSTNAEYSQTINRTIMTFGAEYGFISTSSNLHWEKNRSNIERTDNDYAVYAMLAHRFPKLSLNIGCRLSGLRTELNTTDLSNNHFSIYPSISSRYYISNSYTLGGSISRNTYWPTISQLNPNYSYTDAFHISYGNLNLKPITWTRFVADCNINDISLSFTFVNRKDCIVQNQEIGNGNVIMEYPINANWKNDYSIQADYEIEFSGFEISTFTKLLYSVTKMPDWNQYIKDMCVGLSCDINWNPVKNLSIYSSWFYQSPSKSGLRDLGHQLDASIGSSLKLLNKKLLLSIEVNDLFNRSILPTSYTFSSKSFNERVYNNYHGRGVTFSLRYNFDSVKTKFIFPKMSTTTTNRATIE